jgi:hypothetical protein
MVVEHGSYEHFVVHFPSYQEFMQIVCPNHKINEHCHVEWQDYDGKIFY